MDELERKDLEKRVYLLNEEYDRYTKYLIDWDFTLNNILRYINMRMWSIEMEKASIMSVLPNEKSK